MNSVQNKSDNNSNQILENNDEAGLTLIELLVVVLLIGLIFTVVAGSVFSKGENAKAQLNVTKMESLKQQIAMYRLSYNSFPTSLEDLIRPYSQVKQSGKYFNAIAKDEDLNDVWGNKYSYKSENDGRSYSLTSFGADGIPGGDGPSQDITVRP